MDDVMEFAAATAGLIEPRPMSDAQVQRRMDEMEFDAVADFWSGWYEALAIVRDRMRAGGPGWEPK
jgi:hypothetical protein